MITIPHLDMRPHILVLSLIAIATATATAGAQQSLPPVHPLGPVFRVSAPGLVSTVAAVRTLPGGRLLVNDLVGRRIVLFDSTLASATTVVDSSGSTGTMFGARVAGLIPFRGDSTLFVEPSSLSMLVIDPVGKVARVMAAPRPQDIIYLIGGPFGTPVFDSAGHLIYRGATRMAPPAMAGGTQTMTQPDSAPIVRVDLTTRKLDTVAFYRILQTTVRLTQGDNGMMSMSTKINPMQVLDDWAAFPDGTVAIVRGRDFHVDFIAPDGTHTSAAKIPFDWERLSDSAKAHVVDSTRAVVDSTMARMRERLKGTSGTAQGATSRSAPAGGAPTPPLPNVDIVSPDELPDYRPAFVSGAVRADADGNLWIRTSTYVNGGPVYDVVNRKGELTARVSVPRSRLIAGFGPNGIVYMAVLDGKSARIEEARVR